MAQRFMRGAAGPQTSCRPVPRWPPRPAAAPGSPANPGPPATRGTPSWRSFRGEATARVRGRQGPLAGAAASCELAPRTGRIIPIAWQRVRGDGAVLAVSLGFEVIKQNPKLSQSGAREAHGTRGRGRIRLAVAMLRWPERPTGLVEGALTTHASIRRRRSSPASERKERLCVTGLRRATGLGGRRARSVALRRRLLDL